MIGTYGYMAPEQFGGAALPASDLYGLGGTLLFLLSGVTALPCAIKGKRVGLQEAAPGARPNPTHDRAAAAALPCRQGGSPIPVLNSAQPFPLASSRQGRFSAHHQVASGPSCCMLAAWRCGRHVSGALGGLHAQGSRRAPSARTACGWTSAAA